MKKILCVILTALMLLPLVACGKKAEVIAIQAKYIGGTITEVDYEFSKGDFDVYAVYSDDSTKTITDYEFEIEKMSEGYFHVKFTYGGEENYCYVKCDYDIFGG